MTKKKIEHISNEDPPTVTDVSAFIRSVESTDSNIVDKINSASITLQVSDAKFLNQ